MREQFKTYLDAIEFNVTGGLGYRGFWDDGSIVNETISSWRFYEDSLGLYAHLGMMDYFTNQGTINQETIDYINAANRLQDETSKDGSRKKLSLQLQTQEQVDKELTPHVESINKLRSIRALITLLSSQMKRLSWLEETQKWDSNPIYDIKGHAAGVRLTRSDEITGEFQSFEKDYSLFNDNDKSKLFFRKIHKISI